MRNSRHFRSMVFVAASSMVLGTAASAQTMPSQGPGPTCPCMMGNCMMGRGMMGHGMMGSGMMGPGMMGPGMMPGTAAAQTNLNLSIDDVRGSLEQYLTAMGNPRLKAGHVTATNSNTITADVVTADKGMLVERYAVDRHTGNWHEDR